MQLTFQKGDKVLMINGKIGTVVSRARANKYYYIVNYYSAKEERIKQCSVFCLDMKLIKHKEELIKC